MERYSWQNNNGRSRAGEMSLVLLFGFVAIVFLLLPVVKSPIHDLWRWVALSRLSVQSNDLHIQRKSECIVIATPPVESFDTVLLECNPDTSHTAKNFVWYKTANKRYMVGWVTANRRGHVVARLFSTGNATTPVEIRFVPTGEKYPSIPIGNGAFRVEVPSDTEVVEGSDVYHAVSGQLLGVVSGVLIEKGSYVKRVYVRLPFSFETVTRLDVE